MLRSLWWVLPAPAPNEELQLPITRGYSSPYELRAPYSAMSFHGTPSVFLCFPVLDVKVNRRSTVYSKLEQSAEPSPSHHNSFGSHACAHPRRHSDSNPRLSRCQIPMRGSTRRLLPIVLRAMLTHLRVCCILWRTVVALRAMLTLLRVCCILWRTVVAVLC